MDRDALDLSRMNIPRLFRKYFFPTLAGMLGNCALSAIDGIFVGHGVGSDGIAAVNIVWSLLMVLTGVGLMAGAGCSVVASVHLAQGRDKAARINITQALIFVSAVVVAVALPMMIFPRRTALLLGASQQLLPFVTEYMLWLTPAILFEIWAIVGLFIIRLDGAPRLAMLCSLVPAAVNIVLDWLFIFPLHMGLRGAALATAIASTVGGLMAMAYLLGFARQLRLYPLKLSRKSFLLSCRNIGYQCRIGSSALLSELTMAMLMFMGNHIFMRYLGEDGVGAFGIACYYAPFVFMVGNAVAQSAQPIISYNYGGHDYGRVAATERLALRTAILCGAVVTFAFAVFPRFLTGLFIDPFSTAGLIAIDGLPRFAAGFVFFIVNLTAIGYFQSIERVKPATAFALLRGFVFLIPSFILLPLLMGESGIWFAMPLSEVLTTVLIVSTYLKRQHS